MELTEKKPNNSKVIWLNCFKQSHRGHIRSTRGNIEDTNRRNHGLFLINIYINIS